MWELKQIQFDYFFFDENCSYRLLELLQVARPGLQLTTQFPLTAIPTDTVKAILSYKGVLYRNHLLKGVAKGALSLEQAEAKFDTWMKEKDQRITSKLNEKEQKKRANVRA